MTAPLSVGIRAPVRAEPMTTFSPRLDQRDMSFLLVGIVGAGGDAQTSLSLVAHSENAVSGDGSFNVGRFADAEVGRVIDAMKTEMGFTKHNAMIRSAFLRLHEGGYPIPLRRQMLPWAIRNGVEVLHRPWNGLNLRWVRMD